MQKWVINKETGMYEMFGDYEKEQNKKKQKALFDYNVERIKQDEVSE